MAHGLRGVCALEAQLGHYVDHVLRGTEGLLKAVNIGPELPRALVADHGVIPSIPNKPAFEGVAKLRSP